MQRRLLLPFVLPLLLLFLCQPTNCQVCPAGRSLSTCRFGLAKSAGQGVNESYVYLVFLHDVTGSSSPLECTGTASMSAMQRLEAGLWAASTFNSRYPSILQGVTIGSLVLDDCQSSLLPAQLLGNLQSCETVFRDGAGGSVEPRNIAAFVGVESMDQAPSAFSLTNWASRPALSYSLSSSSLSRSAYPLLARVSPSDLTELDALIQTLRRLGVQHAQVVQSDASVQAGRFAALGQAAHSRLDSAGICVVNHVTFSSSAVTSVATFSRIRPVLLLMTRSDLLSFASQMQTLMPSSGTFTWLLLAEQWDSIGSLVAGRENFFSGALAVEPSSTATYSNYLAYFRSLRPDLDGHAAQNPWLGDFWSASFSCNLPGSSSAVYPTTCNYASNNLQATATVDASAYRVIQSVDLSLHALELVRRQLCPSGSVGLCDPFRSNANRYRLSYEQLFSVGNISYTDVALDPVTGAASKYSLFVNNYQKRYPGHAWTQVATYLTGSFSLTAAAQAYGPDERSVTWAPSGVCDSACLSRCPSNETSTTTPATTAGSMTSSISATTANSSLAQIRYRKQYWVYALIVCASIGIIVTLLFMIYILFKVLALPSELKSFNTLWSGQFLLFIILIGYVFLFAWIPWPSVESCGTIRFMLGFEYVAVFAILMVKLLNLMNDQLKPVYQLLMFVLALCIQIAINVEWLILAPITTPMVAGQVRCGHTFEQHLQSLVYCMALILLCTCLAVRAHSIGRNNRESIFVGCTAGISIPIWIAWCLVGSLNDDNEVKDASQAFGLFINLTLVLLVIFLPKIRQLRRLENGVDTPNEMVVDVFDDNLYDNEDPYAKEPIYMLTQGAPSVISEVGGIGPVYQLASPDLLSTQPSGYFGYARARSLQGDPIVLPLSSGLNGGGTRSVILGSRTPRKAYSDYNPSGLDKNGGPQRQPSAGLDTADAAAAAKGTKAERLAKLGFL